MKPLIILRVAAQKPPAEQTTLLASLAEGIRTGALVLGPECEVIAFDGGGNLVYPLPGTAAQPPALPKAEVQAEPEAEAEKPPLRSHDRPSAPPESRQDLEKRNILGRLKAYRAEHGLGCWKAVAEASGGKVTEDLLRDLETGRGKFPISAWRQAERALNKAEKAKT